MKIVEKVKDVANAVDVKQVYDTAMKTGRYVTVGVMAGYAVYQVASAIYKSSKDTRTLEEAFAEEPDE